MLWQDFLFASAWILLSVGFSIFVMMSIKQRRDHLKYPGLQKLPSTSHVRVRAPAPFDWAKNGGWPGE